jgi:hypothetical protein
VQSRGSGTSPTLAVKTRSRNARERRKKVPPRGARWVLCPLPLRRPRISLPCGGESVTDGRAGHGGSDDATHVGSACRRPLGRRVNTAALALSSLLVLASALVVPAWRTRRQSGVHAQAVRALSVLTLTAALGATAWIVLQVLSLGVHHTSEQPGSASVLGVPIIVLPLALLIVAIGTVEGLIRAHHPLAIPHAIPHAMPQLSIGDDDILELVPRAAYTQAAHSDTIVAIHPRWTRLLEQQARIQATRDAVDARHTGAESTSIDPAAALHRVAEMCTRVTDGLEALRLERPILGEAIALLKQHSSCRPSPHAGRTAVEDIVIIDDEPALVTRSVTAPDTAEWITTDPRRAVAAPTERLRTRVRAASRKVWARIGRRLDPPADIA